MVVSILTLNTQHSKLCRAIACRMAQSGLIVIQVCRARSAVTPCKWPPMYMADMQFQPYGAIVLYVCKQERRKNPKKVIMIDRLKARVHENPKKSDRTICMYSAKVLSMYQVHMQVCTVLLGIIPFLMVYRLHQVCTVTSYPYIPTTTLHWTPWYQIHPSNGPPGE